MNYLDMIAQLLPKGQRHTQEDYELARVILKAKRLEERVNDAEKEMQQLEQELNASNKKLEKDLKQNRR